VDERQSADVLGGVADDGTDKSASRLIRRTRCWPSRR